MSEYKPYGVILVVGATFLLFVLMLWLLSLPLL